MQTYLVWMKPVSLAWLGFKSVKDVLTFSGWYPRGFNWRVKITMSLSDRGTIKSQKGDDVNVIDIPMIVWSWWQAEVGWWRKSMVCTWWCYVSFLGILKTDDEKGWWQVENWTGGSRALYATERRPRSRWGISFCFFGFGPRQNIWANLSTTIV